MEKSIVFSREMGNPARGRFQHPRRDKFGGKANLEVINRARRRACSFLSSARGSDFYLRTAARFVAGYLIAARYQLMYLWGGI